MGPFDRVHRFFKPAKNPDLKTLFNYRANRLPTLWLLGNTGAGKSTLIHAVTGNSRVEIGNGFRPCTMTSRSYDFPEDKPLFRFLDTRGLADAAYDARDDIEVCQNRSNALIVVMKTEEPQQDRVCSALRQIRKSGRIKQVLLVHTGIELVSDVNERRRCISHNQAQVDKAWGKSVGSVELDFEREDGSSVGVDVLKQKLAEMIPIIAQITTDQVHAGQEEKNFSRLKKEILWYAGAAGASDTIPVAGLFSVPAIQAKMLHSIAKQYGIEWNRKLMADFAGTLGAGFGIQYASKLGIRQLVKIIPGYGQTVGSATAAAISFGSTYAIGRVACKYIYHKSKGEAVSEAELKTLYKNAFESIKEAAKNEVGSQ